MAQDPWCCNESSRPCKMSFQFKLCHCANVLLPCSLTVVEIISISERLQPSRVSHQRVKRRVLLQLGELACCVAHKKPRTDCLSDMFFDDMGLLCGVVSQEFCESDYFQTQYDCLQTLQTVNSIQALRA